MESKPRKRAMSEEVSSSAPSHRELYPRMCDPGGKGTPSSHWLQAAVLGCGWETNSVAGEGGLRG